MRRITFFSISALVIILATIGIVILIRHHPYKPISSTVLPTTSKSSAVTPTKSSPTVSPLAPAPVPVPPAVPAPQWQSPLGDPAARVTKIKFGTYVTPQNSPVQPENFTGYHTGWDFEITPSELNADVVISAFCSGALAVEEWASGYGGVAVESCTLSGQPVTIIYGHLNINSVTLRRGNSITIGQKIGLLGANYSTQTDGERKHLHFDIHRGTAINILGYVQNSADLSGWVDPATYLGKLP